MSSSITHVTPSGGYLTTTVNAYGLNGRITGPSVQQGAPYVDGRGAVYEVTSVSRTRPGAHGLTGIPAMTLARVYLSSRLAARGSWLAENASLVSEAAAT